MNNKQCWYAIYTKPNAEKKLHARLIERGFEACLPMRWVEKIWSDRKKIIEEPVFKSYLFARCDVHGQHEIKTLMGFSYFLRFGGYPVTIPDEQIEMLTELNKLHQEMEAQPISFAKGDRVRVLSGPLKGKIGSLVQHCGKHKVGVDITELGQTLLVTLPEAELIKEGVAA
ncbi:UpxY family transcription antiterminator [Shewanella sp. D64]|uniref:UpxY family transcription antiterminator n=1 Tax=unclassified Shewanella TaxID=196818 RepID=UPI0022BA1B71|nr:MULTISPECIES: UpxY family transcription antiterminator [unclassified Shewanella]MEC4725816.1 UpxY family transcription antiterminator [Shewanella sp. D64]MEC4737577.1 UpxY family transcription antiterminator [Shewanella sp. E94]WBJ93395.1 UpxY family transcription antiterminator [Shewanella sp. MTB7]